MMLLPTLDIRRFGILRRLPAWSIDLWWNTENRLSVEALLVEDLDERVFRRVIRELASAGLEPLLIPRGRVEPRQYHTDFSVSGTTLELDLRIQGPHGAGDAALASGAFRRPPERVVVDGRAQGQSAPDTGWDARTVTR